MKRSILAALTLLLTVGTAVQPASAAATPDVSQSVSAWLTQTAAYNDELYMSWSAVPGATVYEVKYQTDPHVTLGTSEDVVWVTGTDLTWKMDASIGYRYFKVYAYNGAGQELAYSNIVGAAKYPSGAVIEMKPDWNLSNTYRATTNPADVGYWDPALYPVPTWFITVNDTVRATKCAWNFTCGEFLSKDTSMTSAVVDPEMVAHVQNARNRYGAPMIVTSGYRTPAYNAILSGSSNFSRHTYGDAVDINVPTGTWSIWDALNGAFSGENPSYVEPFADGGYQHYHADWRSTILSRGYRNW